MFRRPDITILLITDRQVVRGDFSSGRSPRLLEYWRSEWTVAGGLVTGAELAISLGPKLGRRVLVLTTAVWTQTVSVSAQSTAQMTDAELAETLKFEVESFSGVGALESVAAHREVHNDGEQREFWISQFDVSQMISLNDMIAGRGGKLAGVCHPAGLNASINSEQQWRRLEFWPDTICCLSVGGELFLAHADPRSNRWQSAMESRVDSSSINQWLIGAGTNVPSEFLGSDVHRLDEQACAEQWLDAWAATLADGSLCVPVLRPAARPMSSKTKTVRAVAAAALMLAMCIAHWSYVQWSKNSLVREIESLREPEEAKKALDRQTAEAEKKGAELEKELATVVDERRRIAAVVGWRNRMGLLLESLANSRSEDLLIDNIEPDARGLTLSGTAVTPEAATQFATVLRDDLSQRGWQVLPPTQEGKNQLLNGGPWEFQISLRDTQPNEPPAAEESDSVAEDDATRPPDRLNIPMTQVKTSAALR